MQLLPPPGKGRPLALILFAIVVLVGYLLLVHWWFVAPHLQMAGEISQLKKQEALFRGAIASRSNIEERLQEVRTFESGSPSFLPDNDFDAAAAALYSHLRALVTEKSEIPDRCQIASHTPKRSTIDEQYERVTIAVHMRCDIDDFAEVVQALESGTPLLFVDELNIYRQQAGGAVMSRRPNPAGGGANANAQGVAVPLDIRFDVYGYLRRPGPGAASA